MATLKIPLPFQRRPEGALWTRCTVVIKRRVTRIQRKVERSVTLYALSLLRACSKNKPIIRTIFYHVVITEQQYLLFPAWKKKCPQMYRNDYTG